ncbi:MAG: phage tail sheath C-terminal domain-containing protein [Bacteroidota bacterium]
MNYTTPGVYVEEISVFPPSVAQVETAIPAFIGYTEAANDDDGNAVSTFPYIKRIKSYKEYEEFFGTTPATGFAVTVTSGEVTGVTASTVTLRMNYALEMYFANGGGPCYIASAALSSAADFSNTTQLKAALDAVGKEDEPTMLLFPDFVQLAATTGVAATYYGLYVDALTQCDALGDRVALIDLYAASEDDDFSSIQSDFRTNIGTSNLKYGAAYYPYLKTTLNINYDESAVTVDIDGNGPVNMDTLEGADATNEVYHKVKAELAKYYVILPPTSAMAGIYARVDNDRGVWKAPANVSVNYVQKVMVDIDNSDQDDMNVTSSGKSVNAIRKFTGKGILVWGARTLAGNDNEWRYVSVRRFFNMVEESVKKATEAFVFEPNDANTWVKVRAMIENFLTLQWRAGALAGAKPEDAFFVRVGLGQTMTAQDILEGRMNVEIGMAVVRPAEFIILKFSHKMQES